MKDKYLSIAIPTRNDDCSLLVSKLLKQARRETSLDFEILIADDASDNAEVISQLDILSQQKGCRLIRLKENVGRAAVRNMLAREAKYERVLFIDAGVDITNPNFLHTYIHHADDADIICGGWKTEVDSQTASSNLRAKYELS